MFIFELINKKIYIIILILLLFILPVSAVSSGSLIWSNLIGNAGNNVSSVDTSEMGDLVFAALANGNISSYNADGTFRWQTNVNGTVIKIRTVSSGSRLVVLNSINQTYYMNGTDGTIIDTEFNLSMQNNMTDVGIARGDGKTFAVIGNSSIVIYDANGSYYASNFTFPAQGWSLMGYDPYNSWVIATSFNKTFKWNVSSYIGWPEMNFYKDTPNQTNVMNDAFTKKIVISSPMTQSYNLSFVPNTSCADILLCQNGLIQLQNSFWYNRSVTFNFSIRDTSSLALLIDKSNNNFTQILNLSVISGHPNITIYYGNASYKPIFTNGSML